MTSPRTRGTEASVKARLLNLSRQKNRPFQELLQYYGLERFLFRLSESTHADLFILKGALLIHARDIADARATLDIDMLARTSNSLDNVTSIVREVCSLDFTTQDGITFNADTIEGQVMQTQREYSGIRLRFRGGLGSARIPMQVDFGFGDVVTPAPQDIVYPVLLELPPPRLRGYPLETVLAEKLQTMVERGLLNSRVKDYYDVWLLSRRWAFNPEILWGAVKRTFDQRGCQLIPSAFNQLLLTYGASSDRQLQWGRFIKKHSLLGTAPQALSEVCRDIGEFVTRHQV